MAEGRLAENVMHFGRVLRAAGLPIGTDRIALALQVLPQTGFGTRADLKAVLRACFVRAADQRDVFDQAFELFWRDPDLLGRAMRMLLPRVDGDPEGLAAPPEHRRLAGALFPGLSSPPRSQDAPPPEERIDIDAALTFSEREVLRKADFETMTAAEWLRARRMIREQALAWPRVRSRRMMPAADGTRPDWRAAVAASSRRGGEWIEPRWREPRVEVAPVVAIVDISGSMSRYSRAFLHWLHALVAAQPRTQVFLFGTRLTPVTRMLRMRDPDAALAACVGGVDDWSGGTRIAECLHRFNRRWLKRAVGSRATVLLVTDGLEREQPEALGREVERLSMSCRRLWWCNPLLRYAGFSPKAAGVRAMLPHVDAHLPIHDVESLEALAGLLDGVEAVPSRYPRNAASSPSP